MYNYSFRPTFPVFHRSSQFLLLLGLAGSLIAGVQMASGRSEGYNLLPLISISIAAILGFIVQYVRFTERRERGYFMVVDINGFHAYNGRNNDIQMTWGSVTSIDREQHTLLVTDIQERVHRISLGHYQRIDRLRIECLMHQFLMHQQDLVRISQTSELAPVA